MESEEALLAKLEYEVKEDLKNHSVETVLEALNYQLMQLECQSLFATKDGLMGAPNYERLQMLIKIVKTVIAKLESGEIQPPKKLMQTTFDSTQMEPWKADSPLKVRLKEHRRGPRHKHDYRGQTVIDSFIQTP
ncbi:MAG: hypothetical protein QW175_04350 [Candidatus Bathyarchaeia archaeon]